MGFRISEKEYAALLDNMAKQREHGEEPYVNGRPVSTVLRGHNAPPAEPEPISKPQQASFHSDYEQLRPWIPLGLLMQHPRILMVVMLIVFGVLGAILEVITTLFTFTMHLCASPWVGLAVLFAGAVYGIHKAVQWAYIPRI